ncbi:hypothetical protein [Micromonospora sp. NPDC006431]|uniref:hypothetical protein n=1 Tax=Micromonospora sp. NPDC006431 TaxID=3364235 RepID=UPI0036A8EB3C
MVRYQGRITRRCGGAARRHSADGTEDGGGHEHSRQGFCQGAFHARRHHLDDFVACYLPGKPRSERVETERFKSFTYDDLLARDKVNLDITWLRDESLEDVKNLPAPEVLAREIVEDLTAALAEFEAVAAALEAASTVDSTLR